MKTKNEFDLNHITLECFSKCRIPSTEAPSRCTSNEQKTFYRKRILAITRDLSKGKCTNQSLLDAYDTYTGHLIEHFRSLDKSFLLQKQFAGLADCSSEVSTTSKPKEYREDPALLGEQKSGIEAYVVRRRVRKAKAQEVPRIKQINLNSARFRRPRKSVN